MSGQPPYPPAEGAYPSAEGSYPPAEEGYIPPPQTGQVPPQAGYPPPQTGYPPPQTGYPPPQTGYPPPQTGQAPPQGGYPPPQTAPAPQQTQNTTVVVQQPQATTVTNVHFGANPMSYNCHICHTQQVTRVNYKSGLLTWLIVLVLFGLGFICCLFWPFCCVPLCISGTKDAYHTCPNCNNQVGVYKRIG
ncbi:lipopolysaccharide-induced tumor necrosis factor-alpha factor homolog [Dysidea avara]|uniref:lipopolysaccharide-induced tumor necrosis factor-alpha factor homolog n=1 Tax=Dysidea avara TaxID=196820 RepID=UPI00331B2919